MLSSKLWLNLIGVFDFEIKLTRLLSDIEKSTLMLEGLLRHDKLLRISTLGRHIPDFWVDIF